MADPQLTQEMKRYVDILIIKAEHSDLEISRFFKVARSLVIKVCKDLGTEYGNI